MGLCAQIFKEGKKEEMKYNNTNKKNYSNNTKDAITINLQMPSELNVNLHLFVHVVNDK